MHPSALFAILSALAVVIWVVWSLWQTRDASQVAPGALGLFASLWLALPSVVGALGVLSNFEEMPPRILFMFPVVLIAALAFAFSRWGTALIEHFSLAALIGFHTFRVLPETMLLLAYRDGLAPIQLTIEGRNWDIVSAVTALIIFMIYRRTTPPRWLAIVWSILSIGLLINILTVAILSVPTPFRAFHNEPANTFVATFPFILLPTVFVAAAIAGHLLVIRKLRNS